MLQSSLGRRMPTSTPRGTPSRTRPLTLAAIQASVVSCERCPRLRQYCTHIAQEKRRAFREDVYWARPVPGFGDPSARLLVIGLAPAAHGANRTGRMFTGDGTGSSGDFLMAAMHATGFANIPTSTDGHDGLALRDAYITAAVRCAPPGNMPTPGELAACQPFLDDERRALAHIRVIVALGRLAHDAAVRLLGRAQVPRPRFGHGARHTVGSRFLLLHSYHPSRQNTQTGRLTSPMLQAVFQDARSHITARAESSDRADR